jgi:hypothetical protein
MKKLFHRAALLSLGSCGALEQQYVQADRATYNAIAPAYRAYLQADPLLTPDARLMRLDTVESWRVRIESAEAKPK